MAKLKYINKQWLLTTHLYLNKLNLNRQLSLIAINALNGDVIFPCIRSFAHDDHTVRASFAIDGKGSTITVDMPFELFNKIPSIEVEMS